MERKKTAPAPAYPASKGKPPWLKIRVHNQDELAGVETLLRDLNLHTVCEEATCPNRMECFSKSTATFLIMGGVCTRNCRFCDVTHAPAEPLDPEEPEHVAEAVQRLGLKHVVITSVTRDDLADGGAGHFAETIRRTRKRSGKVLIEVLIPDFQGDFPALRTVIDAAPEIINHNVETVPRLYPDVRPQADYFRSVELLRRVKESAPDIYTKSGIMLGLGEREEEVLEVFHDLRDAGCDFLTVGQYLAPSRQHFPVQEYIHPDTFEYYKEAAGDMGFRGTASAPFVRSSYHAAELLAEEGERSRGESG